MSVATRAGFTLAAAPETPGMPAAVGAAQHYRYPQPPGHTTDPEHRDHEQGIVEAVEPGCGQHAAGPDDPPTHERSLGLQPRVLSKHLPGCGVGFLT